MLSLQLLPDEIITRILHSVEPDDILDNVEQSCGRFKRLSLDPLLWKHHCLSSFKYFSQEHRIQQSVQRPVMGVDWRGLYKLRRKRNALALRLLDKLANSYETDYTELNRIIAFDYDVKDLLIQQSQVPHKAGDGLSRSYWSGRILDALHRRRAVAVWKELRRATEASSGDASSPTGQAVLERGLAAFDMFVLRGGWGEIDQISHYFDTKATEYREAHPQFDSMNTRGKALSLNRWLRSQGFRGLRGDGCNYRNLRNCLLSQICASQHHDTIPITSSAIYCAIARRLAIQASCTDFPEHVIVMVRPKAGETLDGDLADDNQPRRNMYLDPFGRDEEFPLEGLVRRASTMPFGRNWNLDRALAPAPISDTLIRLCNNLQATCDAFDRGGPNIMLGALEVGHPQLHIRAAAYAASWAQVMLRLVSTNESPLEDVNRLERFIALLETWHEEDAHFAATCLEELIRERMSQGPAPVHFRHLRAAVARLKAIPARLSKTRQRSCSGKAAHSIQIGQVVKHTRFAWFGVVISCGPLDSADESTSYVVQQASLPEVEHVVSETCLEVMRDGQLVSAESFPFAGELFKHFDPEKCLFVPRDNAD